MGDIDVVSLDLSEQPMSLWSSYPNPVTNVLTIEAGAGVAYGTPFSIRIFNSSGHIDMESEFLLQSMCLDIESLSIEICFLPRFARSFCGWQTRMWFPLGVAS